MTTKKSKCISRAAYLTGLFLVFFTPGCSPQIAPVLEPEPVPSMPSVRQEVHQEIRQEDYQYRPDKVTVIPASESFIITPQASLLPKPESYPFPAVYFPINQYRVTRLEEIRVLESIRNCGYSGSLKVTGYTCHIGTELYNQKLSQQRADTVAGLLKAHGYCVTSSRGQGVLYDADLDRSRRADIRPAVFQTMHNPVQNKCKEKKK